MYSLYFQSQKHYTYFPIIKIIFFFYIRIIDHIVLKLSLGSIIFMYLLIKVENKSLEILQ